MPKRPRRTVLERELDVALANAAREQKKAEREKKKADTAARRARIKEAKAEDRRRDLAKRKAARERLVAEEIERRRAAGLNLKTGLAKKKRAKKAK